MIAPINAYAHGIGGSSGSNSSSRVVEISPKTSEFFARTIENGQRIEIIRKTKNDLIVLGVDLEPYLKFSNSGVFVNKKSATRIINKSTNNTSNAISYGEEFKETSSDPNAPPVWQKVSSKQSYIFHDHRAHYMGNTPDRSSELGSNFLPVRIGSHDYKIKVAFFTRDSPNSLFWFSVLFIFAAIIILLLQSTNVLKFIATKTSLIAMLIALFALELVHVIGYINFVHINFLSSLSQSLYGFILLILIVVCILRISAGSNAEFIYRSAPWLCIVGLFGLIVDTFGEYQFFTQKYLPTNLGTSYSRISLVAIGLISVTILYVGIKNISDKNRSEINSPAQT